MTQFRAHCLKLIRQVESGGRPRGVIQAKLVTIGNSQGLRLAKPLLAQVGLTDEVEIQESPGLFTIGPASAPKAGWAAAAAAVPPVGLLDGPVANRFDDEDWQW